MGNPSPPTGITLSSLPVPNPIPNVATSVSTYTVDPSLAATNQTYGSNTVLTQVNNATLSGIKVVNKAFAACGDTLGYTIVVTNTGSTTAQSIFFKDTIPQGTVLVLNTVRINNVLQTGANPTTGITIPDIRAGGVTTITFVT